MRAAPGGMLALADAVAQLPLQPESFEAGMENLVACVRNVFGFSSACVACLDASWTIGKTYGGDATQNVSAQLIQDFVPALRQREGAFSDLLLWRGSSGVTLQEPVSRRFPGAVACAMPFGDCHVVMLVGEWAADPVGGPATADQLPGTVRLLARLIEKHAESVRLLERRRRLEEERRLEVVGTFADGIAHEFNNLLAAIIGYAEMAHGVLDQHPTARDYVESVLEAGTQAQQMIDQILAFTRTRGKLAAPIDLMDAIVEVLPHLYVCVGGGVSFHPEMPDYSLTVDGNTGALREILVNLCKNAGEALDGHGEVALVVDAIHLPTPRLLSHGYLSSGKYVRIAVSDNGPGIEPEHFSSIVEPFFTTKADNRTGLGLFVVHSAAQSLKGAMHVTSTLGAGTCFEVFLPRSDGEEQPLEILHQLPGVPLGNGELVAIVDPAMTSRLRWEDKLAVAGYEPIAFETIQALVDWYHGVGSLPDAVLVDAQGRDIAVDLPEASGLDDIPWIQVLPDNEPMPKGWLPVEGRVVVKRQVSPQGLAHALDHTLREAKSVADRKQDLATSTLR